MHGKPTHADLHTCTGMGQASASIGLVDVEGVGLVRLPYAGENEDDKKGNPDCDNHERDAYA